MGIDEDKEDRRLDREDRRQDRQDRNTDAKDRLLDKEDRSEDKHNRVLDRMDRSDERNRKLSVNDDRKLDRRLYFMMFGSTAVTILLLIAFLSMQSIMITQNREQLYEDAARAKQTAHEDAARQVETNKTLTHVDRKLDLLQNNITGLFRELHQQNIAFEERSNQSSQERLALMERINDVLEDLGSKSKEHNKIAEEMNNLTAGVSNNLTKYGENSIQKFDHIQNSVNNNTDKIDKLIELFQIF